MHAILLIVTKMIPDPSQNIGGDGNSRDIRIKTKVSGKTMLKPFHALCCICEEIIDNPISFVYTIVGNPISLPPWTLSKYVQGHGPK